MTDKVTDEQAQESLRRLVERLRQPAEFPLGCTAALEEEDLVVVRDPKGNPVMWMSPEAWRALRGDL